MFLSLPIRVNKIFFKKKMEPQLVWLSGFERWPANQRVASLIPSQGTCLGCGPGSLVWGVRKPHTDVLSLSFRLLKKKEKKKLVWLSGLSTSLQINRLLV